MKFGTMNVDQMTTIAKGNPFLSDLYNMGYQVGTNITVMYAGFPKDHQRYIIVCNTKTGERIRITF
jgi:hypothetical protein